MRCWRVALALVLLLSAAGAHAEAPRPFMAESAAQIRAAHVGRPYVLALWSLECPHCAQELAMLGALRQQHPELKLVLIATDTPDEQPALVTALAGHGLLAAENWVFADSFQEPLRYAIDRHWQGELPRSYLVGRDGVARSHSGPLTRAQIEAWLEEQRQRP